MTIDARGLYHRLMHEHRLSAPECDLMCHAATLVHALDQSLSAPPRQTFITHATGRKRIERELR